ncbi:MAG: AAA family ATPase [Chloroflexota bacterium]
MDEARVILVEEADRRAELRKALATAHLNVVDEAGFGSEASLVAREAAPDAIILSMEEPIVRPLRSIEALTLAHPNLPIIVVSSFGDRDHLRKAMQAGARDFLTKPLKPQELQAAVAALLETESRRQAVLENGGKSLQAGEIITVYGVKGGIGKTSMSINLAEAIARQTGQRVGVLDLDLQLGDTAVLLGFLPEYTVADAAASVDRLEPELLQSLMWSDPQGVFVLPAPLRPEEAEEITADQVRAILTVMSHTFDYVVVDTPPQISDNVAAALDLSTLVLLLTTQEVLALRRTKVAVQLLRGWGFNEDKIKLVINHAYSSNGASAADIESGLDYKIFWQVPNDTAIPTALRAGMPFVKAYPNSRAGKAVNDLARAVCGLEVKKGNIVGKLWHR